MLLKDCPKIDSLYLPLNEMMEEPSYVKDAPKIVEAYTASSLDFYYLSADPEPFHRQYYRKPEDRILCGHDESLDRDDNKCALCGVAYDDSFDQEWLQCPSCTQ